MPEYRAIKPKPRPAAFDDWDYGDEPKSTMLVLEPDVAPPVNTGLLNAQGVPLYRLPPWRRIGFIHSRAKE